jgi:hypothetical protein
MSNVPQDVISLDDCIAWLEAKWKRHGEEEDKAAADYLRELRAQRQQGVEPIGYVNPNPAHPDDWFSTLKRKGWFAVFKENPTPPQANAIVAAAYKGKGGDDA